MVQRCGEGIIFFLVKQWFGLIVEVCEDELKGTLERSKAIQPPRASSLPSQGEQRKSQVLA